MIKYYNILDEMIREYPKNMHRQFNDNEKYYIRENEDPVNNNDFVEVDQLEVIKQIFYDAIDTKTKELIDAGKVHFK